MTEQFFEIESVSPTDPPRDAVSSEWHSYVITQGDNTIRGYREGNLKTVTLAAEAIFAQLNERRMGKRARAHLVIAANKRS